MYIVLDNVALKCTTADNKHGENNLHCVNMKKEGQESIICENIYNRLLSLILFPHNIHNNIMGSR